MDDMELIMPFVVCASEGGPYEDEAFTAGFHLGLLYQRLEGRPPTFTEPVRTACLAQVDLIAMKHGYVVGRSEEDNESDFWRVVTFERSA